MNRHVFALVLLAAAALMLLVSAKPAQAQKAWAAANSARLYRNNGGASWTNGNSIVTNAGDEYGIDFINSQIGWSVGFGTSGPVILKSTNGGVSWSTQLTGGSSTYNDVDFINNFNGWVVGDAGKIITTSNGGTNWTAQTSLVSANLHGVNFLSATNGYIAGDNGVVLKTTNGGSNWTPISVPSNLNLQSVAFNDPLNGWVAGSSNVTGKGVIARTTDGGAHWTQTAFNSIATLNDIQFTDTQVGFAVGSGGTVWKTANAGQTWTQSSVSTSLELFGVDFRNTQEGYIVGGDPTISPFGVILHTGDGGATWTSQGFGGGNIQLYDVSLVTSNSMNVSPGANVNQSFSGGAATTGGTTVSFPSVTTLGTLAADSVALNTLVQQTQSDFNNFPNYHFAGSSAQLWTVSFDGQFTGTPTLQFGINPTLLTGVDLSKLVVLRRDDVTGQITVLTPTSIANNVLTVQTPGFSTFELALLVPEPSSVVLAGMALLGLGTAVWRKKFR